MRYTSRKCTSTFLTVISCCWLQDKASRDGMEAHEVRTIHTHLSLKWINPAIWEERRTTASGHFITHYPWYSLMVHRPSDLICSHPIVIFFPTSSRFDELFCSAIFLPDFGGCNNSNYSVLLYKVTVKEAWQDTIFPDRLLICHSYCCGYCMTVHVLSSSSLLTFMFHLISLLFLGVYDIKILSCCLF